MAGVKESINFLESVFDMMKGNANASSKITVKWDGAPAIFAGIDPETKKFFVGTKGIFNKNPKLNFTNADIERNHEGELASKLKIALKELPTLGIKGVLQGDIMFTKSDLKVKDIDGESFVTFRPNTIMYAVQKGSPQEKEISSSKIGIVWHTEYKGSDSLQDMSASFNINIDGLKKSKNVWFQDATFKDQSGSITFTESETKNIESAIKNVKTIVKKVDSKFINSISGKTGASNLGIFETVQWFINVLIREGKIVDGTTFVKLFTKGYSDKLDKKIKEVKSDKGKGKWNAVKKDGLDFIKKNKKLFITTMDLHKAVSDAKTLIIRKLETVKGSLKTFVPTDNGFKLTGEEGFVGVDKIKGNGVKFVDRLEFSKANFNVAKDWIKGAPNKIPEPKLK